MREQFARFCIVCGNRFTTTNHKKIVCGFDCKQERNRERARRYKDKRPRLSKLEPEVIKIKMPKKNSWKCAVCEFDKTIDLHHLNKKEYPDLTIPLCPNHHALIHRGLLKLDIELRKL